MKLSELGDKEIVNLANGSRYGQLSSAELLFDEHQGLIKAILVPDFRGKMSLFGNKDFLQLPWSTIRKIGEDIVIVDAPDS